MTDNKKTTSNEVVTDILTKCIELLDALSVNEDIDIINGYITINVINGVKLSNDINSYISSNVIPDLTRQYINKYTKFTNSQLDLMKLLLQSLERLEKPHLFNLTPETLFINPEKEYEEYFGILPGFDDNTNDNDPLIFRTLEVRLTILLDFLKELREVYTYKENYKIINTLFYTISEKLELLDEVYSDVYKSIFSNKLNFLCKKNGISQSKLSRKLGVRQGTVSEWFRAVRIPPIHRAIEIAKYLNTSLDYLLRPDADEMFLTGGYIAKETGLSIETINKMQNLKSDTYYTKSITKILDLLIQNYHKSNTDLLSEITKYLQVSYKKNMYLISDEELNTLADTILEDCNDIREVKAKISDFTSFIEREVMYKTDTVYDVSNIQLQNITKILIRIKDALLKEE